MAQVAILYTSAQVRKAIVTLFQSSAPRRVAIVAFVGQTAEAYLPHPDGLELVCWPKAGGTNPSALRRLIRKGARVSFVDSLHMKIYWAEGRGAVVTSANLSSNALGAGDLKEFGVLLPPDRVNIDRLLASLRTRPASAAELARLDKAHHSYQKLNSFLKPRPHGPTFTQWVASPFPQSWRLGWWDEVGAVASTARRLVRERYGTREPHQYLSCRKSDFSTDDWVLGFSLERESPSAISWIAVDHILPISRADTNAYSSAYPHQAIQVWPLNRYPPPPFRVDKRFRKAFSRAVQAFGRPRIKALKRLHPPKKLLDMIAAHY